MWNLLASEVHVGYVTAVALPGLWWGLGRLQIVETVQVLGYFLNWGLSGWRSCLRRTCSSRFQVERAVGSLGECECCCVRCQRTRLDHEGQLLGSGAPVLHCLESVARKLRRSDINGSGASGLVVLGNCSSRVCREKPRCRLVSLELTQDGGGPFLHPYGVEGERFRGLLLFGLGKLWLPRFLETSDSCWRFGSGAGDHEVECAGATAVKLHEGSAGHLGTLHHVEVFWWVAGVMFCGQQTSLLAVAKSWVDGDLEAGDILLECKDPALVTVVLCLLGVTSWRRLLLDNAQLLLQSTSSVCLPAVRAPLGVL